jgi:glycosyltransferase involved in cell wall biosynthesis
MFSKAFTIYPLLALRDGHSKVKIILSPRGMLKDSALRFKPLKKKLFLSLLRLTGIHRNIHFHASDATEEKDVLLHFGRQTRVSCIPNLPGIRGKTGRKARKLPGELSMVFVGRVHPIKNLDFLLQRLKEFAAPVRLSIVGGKEDVVFWNKCQDIIRTLPSTVTVDYLGEKAHAEILDIVGEHHIFTLPTRGENFGHAIFEALSLGKPVLISDQTPWRSLYPEKAGWDIPLDDPAGFEQAIREAASWDQEKYDEWSERAFQLANRYMDNSNAIEKYRELFS